MIRVMFIRVLTILFVFSFMLLRGGDIVYVEKRLPKVGLGYVSVSGVSGRDTLLVYPRSGVNFRDWGVVSEVELGVDVHSGIYEGDSLNVRVVMEFYDMSSQGGSSLLPFVYNLEVRYHPRHDREYVDRGLLRFDKAYEYKSRVKEIWVNGVQKDTLPGNMYINQRIRGERYYDLGYQWYGSSDDVFGQVEELDRDCDGQVEGLGLSWGLVLGAEEYELEWSYVSDYGSKVGVYKGVNELSYDFGGNSTRVRIKDTRYELSNVYDRGYIVYRLRPIGRDKNVPTREVVGIWNRPSQGLVGGISVGEYYHNTGAFSGDKNWSYMSSYSEGGKKSEGVMFMDGSLRERQGVKSLASQGQVVVSEQIYDYQGRPVIQVLPGVVETPQNCVDPGKRGVLKYYDLFNVDDSLQGYGPDDFDRDGLSGSCGAAQMTGGMHPSKGSSKYYSVNNIDKEGGQGYVPVANKYPFSQVEYTGDLTGRVSRRTMAGEQFKIGSGHEQKFYYGKPSQAELDRLFGSEVGDASHYQKMMEVDGQGVSSLKYLDMGGRVIATALTGDSVGGMHKLPSQQGSMQVFKEDLLEKDYYGKSKLNRLNVQGDALEFSREILVGDSTQYTFTYGDTIGFYQQTCMDICFNCVYDLDIVLQDECGDILWSVDTLVGGVSVTSGGALVFDVDCLHDVYNPWVNGFSGTVGLGPGVYTLSKRLSLHQGAIDHYMERYMGGMNDVYCTVPYTYFLQQELSLVDTLGCDIDCDDYQALKGDKDGFIARGGSIEQYEELMGEYSRMCEQVSICQTRYEMMLEDMSPGGQYGGFEYRDDTVYTSLDKYLLSIFRQDNRLPSSIAQGGSVGVSWRVPLQTYVGQDGQVSKIYLEQISGNDYVPQVLDPTLVEQDEQGYYTYPENLLRAADFIRLWEPSWAGSLVGYHPEYCLYEDCKSYDVARVIGERSSRDFDGLLDGAGTFAQAQGDGLIISSGVNAGKPSDWFVVGTGPYDGFVISSLGWSTQVGAYNYSQMLKDSFNLYRSIGGSTYKMWEVAAIAARCPVSLQTGVVNSSCRDFGSNFSGNSYIDTKIRDKEWELLRAFYKGSKNRLMDLKRRRGALTGTCHAINDCFGVEDYDGWVKNGLLSWTLGGGFVGNNLQPCALANYEMYASKQARFRNEDFDKNLPDSVDQRYLESKQYLSTGECNNGMNVQGFLTELANFRQLDNDNQDIKHYGSVASLYSGMWRDSSIINIPGDSRWYVTGSGGLLTGFIKYSGNSKSIGFTINKLGSGMPWDSVKYFVGYKTTYGGVLPNTWAEFDIYAVCRYGGKDSLIRMEGSAQVDVLNCDGYVKDCEPGRMMRQAMVLMSALARSSKLMQTSAFTLANTAGVGAYADYLGETMAGMVYGGQGGTFNYTWRLATTGFPPKPYFELDCSDGQNRKLEIYVAGTLPANYSLSNVAYFGELALDSAKGYEMWGYNLQGQRVVKIWGQVKLNMSGTRVVQVLGDCDPIQSGDCDDLTSDFRDYLGNYFSHNAYGGPPRLGGGGSTLATAYLPEDGCVGGITPGGLSSSLLGGYQYDTLEFNLACCDSMEVYRKSVQGSQTGLSSVVSLSGFRTYGESGIDGGQHHFYALALFASGVIDTVWGYTCLPLMDCNPCGDIDFISYGQLRLGGAGVGMQALATGAYIDCDTNLYNAYKAKVNSFNSYLAINSNGWLRAMYDTAVIENYGIVGGNYCGCIEDYIAMLDRGMLGNMEVPIRVNSTSTTQTHLSYYCQGLYPRPCPLDTPALPVIAPPTQDPCKQAALATATLNAKASYQAYLDSMQTDIVDRYKKHCLGIRESLVSEYNQGIYHYTLFYYDQAGSLVKTVPPQGVELLDVSVGSSTLQRIKKDRALGTRSVFTQHRLYSMYRYNSLGQLTAQGLTDQDKMDIFVTSLSEGLQSNLQINEVDFVAGGLGYLSGNVGSRGYVYRTQDGGASWQAVRGLSGVEIRDIDVVGSTAYGVGSDGVFLRSSDGGMNWDLNNLYNRDVRDTLLSVCFRSNLQGVVGASSGKIYYTSSGGLNFSLSTISNPYPNSSITSITKDGTNYLASADYTTSQGLRVGGFYQSSDGINWTRADQVDMGPLSGIHLYAGTGSSTRAYACGQDGTLLHTQDGGLTWAMVRTDMVGDFKDLHFVSDQLGGAIIHKDGFRGIYLTHDGGKTWTLESDPGFDYVSMSKSWPCVVVGKMGRVARLAYDAPSSSIALINMTGIGVSEHLQVGCMSGNYVVVGGSGDKVWMSLDGRASQVIWSQYLTGGISAGDSIESIVLVNTSSSRLSGALTSRSGKLYYMHKKQAQSNLILTSSGTTGTYSGLAINKNVLTPGVGSKKLFVLYDKSLAKVQAISQVMDQDQAPGGLQALGSSVTGLGNNMHRLALQDRRIMLVDQGGVLYQGDFASTSYDVLGGISSNYKMATQPIKRVLFNGASVYGVGDNGRMYKRETSGVWKRVNTYVRQDLRALAFVTSLSGYVGGKAGAFYGFSLSTLGAAMTSIPTYVQEDILDMALGAQDMYVSGSSGVVLYSASKTNVSFHLASRISQSDLNALMIHSATGSSIAMGSEGYAQWNKGLMSSEHTGIYLPAVKDVHFYDSDHGLVAAGKYTLRYTGDGGKTWKVVLPYNGFALGAIPTLEKVVLKSPYVGFGVGVLSNKEYLCHINTQGFFSFDVLANPSTGSYLYDIVFTSSYNGYAVGKSSTGKPLVKVSTNGGITWGDYQDNAASAGQHILAVEGFARNNSLIMVGTSKYIKTFKNNNTFSNPFTLPGNISSSVNFKDVEFVDDYTGYVVGSMGVILKSENLQLDINQNYQAGTFVRKRSDDNLNQQFDSTKMDILAIGMRDLEHGFLGGSYAYFALPGGVIPPSGYGRVLLDQGRYYSQLFWYDDLGRLVLSQNSKQYAQSPKQYSYVLFDALGRPVESGQKSENTLPNMQHKDIFGYDVQGQYSSKTIDPLKLKSWINHLSGPRTEVNYTYYDQKAFNNIPPGFTQNNLRKRISSTVYEQVYDTLKTTYDHATHYSYDIHGNVSGILQDNPKTGISGQQFKRMDYSYDLISGNVKQLSYQTSQKDQWHHKYEYDKDNRLVGVLTSKDKYLWDQDAKYFYYDHGPLARVELAQNQAQGVDYLYTLQGWIKGVNSTTLQTERDPGRDADNQSNNPNKKFAKDVFSYGLYYHQNDYHAIESNYNIPAYSALAAAGSGSDLFAARYNLYNGNISAMATTVLDSATLSPQPMGYAYQYDKLNRLVTMKAFNNVDPLLNNWEVGSIYNNRYLNTFTYDGSGNILSQHRYDQAGSLLDKLSYNYPQVNNKTVQNRLRHVDELNVVTPQTDDLEDQNIDNYTYTQLGELKRDQVEQIEEIIWRVDGKISEIRRTPGSTKKNLKFSYDSKGQRVAKHVHNSAGTWEKSIYYTHDASGNVLAVYEKKNQAGSQKYNLIERHIYAGKRLGTYTQEVSLITGGTTGGGGTGGTPIPTPTPLPWPGGSTGGGSMRVDTSNQEQTPEDQLDQDYTLVQENQTAKGGVFGLLAMPPQPLPVNKSYYSSLLAKRNYELTNHLGNVLSVITDKVIPIDQNSDGLTDSYQADLVSVADYYPFGAIMPERSWEKKDYRYSFQGQEHDDQVKGDDNSINYTYRMHDPRLGRFLSLDPLYASYPHNSPYAFSENRVIDGVELEGLEFYYAADGSFLGQGADKESQEVHLATCNTVFDNETGLEQKIFININLDGTISDKPVRIYRRHHNFKVVSNIVRLEGRMIKNANDPKELLKISHTAYNRAIKSGKTLYKLLKSKYSSVKNADKVPLSEENTTEGANNARMAIIHAMLGGEDPTFGAEYFDGTDFLAWGLNSPNGTPQNKFEEYSSIRIPYSVLNKYLEANLESYNGCVKYKHNGVKMYFDIPADIFADPNNYDSEGFYYDTCNDKPLKLIGTTSSGNSIFWKTEKSD